MTKISRDKLFKIIQNSDGDFDFFIFLLKQWFDENDKKKEKKK